MTLEKHPNADTLSIIPVFGYTYVGKTADWTGVTKMAYIPPDSVVDTRRPEFAFLAEKAREDFTYRVKAMKLRQVVSYGLGVPVPDDTPLGEDWAEKLGVTHYEPPINEPGKGGLFMGGEVASAPNVYTVKYDLDAFLRHHSVFTPGEPVVVTEKLDGASARYVWLDGKMHCGSREQWKKEYPTYDHVTVEYLVGKGLDEEKAKETVERLHSRPKRKNLWWEVLEQTPELERLCRAHPGAVIYGEVYGSVNCIKYGFADGRNRFAAFDVMQDGRWLDAENAFDMLVAYKVPCVPLLNKTSGEDFLYIEGIPYDFETIKAMAEGKTLVEGAREGTIREGVVVKPLKERTHERVGRVCFKVVSPVFLERYR